MVCDSTNKITAAVTMPAQRAEASNLVSCVKSITGNWASACLTTSIPRGLLKPAESSSTNCSLVRASTTWPICKPHYSKALDCHDVRVPAIARINPTIRLHTHVVSIDGPEHIRGQHLFYVFVKTREAVYHYNRFHRIIVPAPVFP